VRVAIVGAGLQCRRRAPAVLESPPSELVVISSLTLAHARATAALFGCEATDSWPDVVQRSDVNAVLVCTPPHVHAEIAIAALRAGKHVLCEKPLSRTLAEAEAMVAAAQETGQVLKCGFNHRHHPAVAEARRRVERGEIGHPIFARCRYGICGRPGYEKEWRADPARAAGGHFMEQGSHAIDLFRWFMGEVAEVSCMTATGYFTGQPLEDNGMALFRMVSGATACLHTSLTQWKNLFSLEVFGDDGYLQVEGLGASYGTERLLVGRRDFDGPFHDSVTEYRGPDVSWRDEWGEFVTAVRQSREPTGSGRDGLAAMRVALAAYEAERQRRVIRLEETLAR
jgi:predicted dehydrogenase